MLTGAVKILSAAFAAMAASTSAQTQVSGTITNWTSGPNMPTARYTQDAAVINGVFYVVGGSTPSTSVADLYEYDPVANEWTVGTSMPTPRGSPGAAELDGRLYVVGGYSTYTESFLGTLEIYDPATGQWSPGASVPTGRRWPATAAIGGKLYVVGGANSAGGAGPRLETLEIYDPATGQWSPGSSMPTAREQAGAAVVDGQLYVVGGRGENHALATLEVYDPATDQWSRRADMPIAGTSGGVGVIDGKLYIVVMDTVGYQGQTLEIYDPAKNTWVRGPNMPTGRSHTTAEAIEGKLYVVGGYNGSSLLSTLEIFDSAGNTWIAANSPYRVTGAVTVPVGDTLTIEPGVDVLFNADVPFIVEGSLQANGTQADSVRFLPGVSPEWDGGGLYVYDNCDIALEDCSIVGNYAEYAGGGGVVYTSTFGMLGGVISDNTGRWDYGGGLWLGHSDATASGVGIYDNLTIWGGGGGLFFEDSCTVDLSSCTISGNDAAYSGAGVHIENSPSALIVDCDISDNTSHEVEGCFGGGAYIYASNVTIQDSRIAGNLATYAGGALWIERDTDVHIERTLIADNVANVEGGAIAAWRNAGVDLVNCTVAGNTNTNGVEDLGGGFNVWISPISITNTIVHGNVPSNAYIWAGDPVSFTAEYSDFGGDTTWAGTGNITADPMFVDAANGDYSLAATSPAINAGDPASPLDPDGSRADMGAYPYENLVGGDLTAGVWTAAASPYYVVDTLFVPADSTLIIEAGVEVLFENNVPVVVEGSLSVAGAEGDTVRFAPGAAAAWGGLRFSGGDTSLLAYARVTGVSNPSETGGGILVSGGGTRLGLMHVLVDSNDAYVGGGMAVVGPGRVHGTHVDVRDNEAGYKAGGVTMDGGALVALSSSSVSGNLCYSDGGGIYVDFASLYLVDCDVSGNTADSDDGAGLYISGAGRAVPEKPGRGSAESAKQKDSDVSRPGRTSAAENAYVDLLRCSINANVSGDDGAAFFVDGGELIATDCEIVGNTSGYYAGGFDITNAVVELTRCLILDNYAAEDGGVFETSSVLLTVTDCVIDGNTGNDGGVLWAGSGTHIFNGCQITNNVDEYDLGAFTVYGGALIELNNCTVSGNSNTLYPTEGGALTLYNSDSAAVSLSNTIVWGNTPGDVWSSAGFGHVDALVAMYSIVGGDSVWPGDGNLNVDPLFVASESADYRLRQDSPAINAGDPASPTDPDGSPADIGAHPFSTIFGDASRDGAISALDASHILQNVVGILPAIDAYAADVTGNGDVTAWDASHVLLRVVNPEFVFPVEEPLVARTASGETRRIWWENANGLSALRVDNPAGIEAGQFVVELASDAVVTVESSTLIQYRREGSELHIAFARTGGAGDVLFAISGAAGEVFAPQVLEASFNEGTVPFEIGRPLRFELAQNAPNPFNPSTSIRFTVPDAGPANLAIYDVNGRFVRSLISGPVEAGRHHVTWDGRDAVGRDVASGVYVCRLTAGEQVTVRAMTLVR